MDRGDLVSDEIVIGIIAERLIEPDCAHGAIFDGFPRTIAQAEALDRLLEGRGKKIDVAIELKVNDEILLQRSASRVRRCALPGLTPRADDTPETLTQPAGGVLPEHRPADRVLPKSGQTEDG